jgi:phosphoglycolate phosphatase-like HAD superfamily hydrolase
MDGSELVKSLAAEAGENAQQRASELHSRYYQDTAPLLRVLPCARELLTRVAALGLQVVLATSAPEDELSILRELLDSEDIVSTVTSSEDVETAKPDPAIVEIALRRAGVLAPRAVLSAIQWDAKASLRAGVPVVGVLSCAISRAELESAGASVVLDNAADLLTNIDTTPIAIWRNWSGADHP